jgi:hypothetical protein
MVFPVPKHASFSVNPDVTVYEYLAIVGVIVGVTLGVIVVVTLGVIVGEGVIQITLFTDVQIILKSIIIVKLIVSSLYPPDPDETILMALVSASTIQLTMSGIVKTALSIVFAKYPKSGMSLKD